jgi:hypothetical protein
MKIDLSVLDAGCPIIVALHLNVPARQLNDPSQGRCTAGVSRHVQRLWLLLCYTTQGKRSGIYTGACSITRAIAGTIFGPVTVVAGSIARTVATVAAAVAITTTGEQSVGCR